MNGIARYFGSALSVISFSAAGFMLTSCASSTPPATESTATTTGQCVPFAPEAPCGSYVSTSASDGKTPVKWAKDATTKVRLEDLGGSTRLVVVTPCAPINARASIQNGTMTVSTETVVGAQGCVDEIGEQQHWLREFLKKPIQVSYKAGILTWQSDESSILFKLAP